MNPQRKMISFELRKALFIVIIGLSSLLQGRNNVKQSPLDNNRFSNTVQDSKLLDTILTEVEYLAIVSKYHPVVKQSDLLIDQGNAYIRKGRGGFDPKLFFDFKDKDFKTKNYYDLAHGGLKVPTWYGVEFKNWMGV